MITRLEAMRRIRLALKGRKPAKPRLRIPQNPNSIAIEYEPYVVVRNRQVAAARRLLAGGTEAGQKRARRTLARHGVAE